MNSEPKSENKTEHSAAELREPRWAVISFDKCEASSLDYAAAETKLAELLAQKISGLCIITDEAAAKILSANG